MTTTGLGRTPKGHGGLLRLAAVALLGGVALAASGTPAAAASRSFYTDSGGTYACGSPAMGMQGVLRVTTGTTTCTTTGSLAIPASPTSATIATFYTPAVLFPDRDMRIRGTSLFLDIVATTPGGITVELGYGPNTSTFVALGSVEAQIANTLPVLNGVNVDLSTIWDVVPAGNLLALRLTKRTSGFAGSLSLHNPSGFPPIPPSSLRGSFFEGAWVVPGDYATIQDAISSPDVVNGDRVYLKPGTYPGAGFRGLTFGGKGVTVVGIEGAERTIIDGEYATSSFGAYFNSGETSQAGLEGITFTRMRIGAVNISGGSYPIIRNCVFRDNERSSAGGGAIGVYQPTPQPVLIEGCTFENNRTPTAMYGGGAVAIQNTEAGSPVRVNVRNCTFTRNAAYLNGGAVYVEAANSLVDISGSTFRKNVAQNGGAIHATTAGSVAVHESRFVGNLALIGGAVVSRRVALTNCVFAGNEAVYYGGAVVFNGGSAAQHTVLNHCTVSGNRARLTAGVLVELDYATIVNSILWGNEQVADGPGKEIYIAGGIPAFANVGNTILEGGIAQAGGDRWDIIRIDGGNIVDRDPLLAFAESPSLQPGSPAIDAADPTPTLPSGVSEPTQDIDSVGRRLTACASGTPDMGAFEYHGDCGTAVPAISTARVDLSAREGGSPPDAVMIAVRDVAATPLRWAAGEAIDWLTIRPPAEGESSGEIDTATLIVSSGALPAGVYRGTVTFAALDPVSYPGDAAREIEVVLTVTRERRVPGEYATIQAAIDASNDGDEIIVADGLYASMTGFLHLTNRNKSLAIRSENGPDATIIDCNNNASTRAMAVELGDADLVFQGFTVRNCTGSGSPREGGAIFTGPLTSITLLENRFEDNRIGTHAAFTKGGAVSVGGTAFIANCSFTGNDADLGGGVHLKPDAYSTMKVHDSTFSANTASMGGGLYISQVGGSRPAQVLNSLFSGNSVGTHSAGGGGGARVTGQDALVEGCAFINNSNNAAGGGLYVGSGARVANSVFSGNSGSSGGGLYVSGASAENCTMTGNSGAFGGGAMLFGPMVNSIAWGNTDTAAGTASDDIYPQNSSYASYSAIGTGWTASGDNNLLGVNPLFVNSGDPEGDGLRLQPASPLIDRGRNVNWLFSDRRGSVRAVDGPDTDTVAKFDMGAYEYSQYYGGIGEDETAKAFRDLAINGSVVATGYEYRIQWTAKDPFPYQTDGRAMQAGEYEARLLLQADSGLQVELGTWVMRLGQQYTVPFVFGARHVGTWRIRVEMASDPNQFTLSEPVTIQYKELVVYTLGRQIPPPPGAVAGQRPDVDYPDAVYWSTETNRLYAIAPFPVQITWYQDASRTIPILVMGIIQTPPDPQFHVADAPPVVLIPEGSRFSSVGVLWSDSSAAISADSFSAPQDGWTTLLFKDSLNPLPEQRELFTVVRTLTWNHAGTSLAPDPFWPTYPGSPFPPTDPDFPVEKTGTIGTQITDAEHDREACGGGYVVQELAPYDGAGDNRAHDRATRTGPIFPVNEDDPATEDDDIVVVWYQQQGPTGVCWPFKPVRYDPVWPLGDLLCETGVPAGTCTKIDITSQLGSGPLQAAVFGTIDTMLIYSQPDRRLPGFNPNEEHAGFFAAGGGEYPGAFPLRTDLNRFDWGSPPFTSRAYVLLKYRDPQQAGEWNFKAWFVDPGSLTYSKEAGTEFNPPYPLNQFVFGPCRDTATAGHNGTWTDAELYLPSGANDDTAEVLKDKDNKLFAIRGGVTVTSRYFYRLAAEFWLDQDDNGYPDKPAGTCIPWLEGLDGTFDGETPAPVTYDIVWPTTPTLFVGETLTDAKTQAGESVGLPNIKDQCIVQVLHDEAEVRLFDPVKEYAVALPSTAFPRAILKLDPPTGSGSVVRLVDLPYHIQSRLTYDDVAEELKLKGRFVIDTGEPTLHLNTLSARDLELVKSLCTAPACAAFRAALDGLKSLGDAGLTPPTRTLKDADVKALSAGSVTGTGYVTVSFNNHEDCAAPTVLNVINVGCPLYAGELKVIESVNVFDEKLTLRHNADFGGGSDNRYFQWYYAQSGSGIPEGPAESPSIWFPFDPANSDPGPTNLPPTSVAVPGEGTFYRGLVDITPKGTGQQLLPDRWFSVRYRYAGFCGDISPWTRPQLAEGWVKRVMKKVNLFDQKVKDFHTSSADTLVSMISQAGRAYEGDVALSEDPEYLKGVGLIELYETLLRRAISLGLDTGDPDVKKALLFATNRVASLYLLLGNEAFADAADPTIGFGTQDGQYGAMAPSIHAFQNQADTLLEEELVLLRGRDAAGVRPFYNRFAWNFTIADGEVAYRQVYDIEDVADSFGGREPDGEINEYDAKMLYPQGHGDAWGHYLLALKRFYALLTDDTFLWEPTIEALVVAQSPVEVDYRDERAFASAAAARARTGAQVVALTYRLLYDEDPERQWQGYRDPDPKLENRAWGLAEWASRAGQGAYIDWAVGNALLPAVDPDPAHEGIKKVDRTSVVELFEVPGQYDAVQSVLDQADAGLNPLGVAKETIPFDIDPALVSLGQTHFEQIYGRALQALTNAVTVFDYANQGSQLLRRQQDRIEDFQRTVGDREADFTNRLVEIFGYPYTDDCGPNRLYPTGYCETGPDLYHYMYVEPSKLMGEKTPREHTFTVNFRDLAVDDGGGLVAKEVPVELTVDLDRRFGIMKPSSWQGRRRAPGALQLARADLLQLRGRFEQALMEYDALIRQIEDQAGLLKALYDLNADEIRILQEGRQVQASINDAILGARESQLDMRSAAEDAFLIANAAMEAIPKVLGVGFTVITDPLSVIRGVVLTGAQVASIMLNQSADRSALAEMSNQQSKEIAAAETNLQLVARRQEYSVEQQVLQLDALVRREALRRQEIYTLIESLRQSAQRYLVTLAAGERILEERLRFRKQTAAQVQDYRYHDMTFRVFRNDALQKYLAQLDLASRYTYLAAKAYDYETTLLDSSGMAGQAFLEDIVRERSIGTVIGGQPLSGIGLADTLRRLSQNFQVLKPQLGFNNPQRETNRFSLRRELFRVRFDPVSDGHWRDALAGSRVDDLWEVPEFRRLCRPFAAEGTPQPGLVIPFRTTVTSGLNFFGWPLGGGDSYYSAANFATKVRSVGVWFSNYNATGLAQTPRVYLVPAGQDVLRSPTGGYGDIRGWHVLDQKMPTPFPINPGEMAGERGWIPAVNTILDEFGQVRRHADFKAHHDSGSLEPSEMTYDTRLIGRSVWNTKWLLIIPGRNLLYDPGDGLDTFISGPEVPGGAGERSGNGISDIKLFFETYAYSGI